jgi:lipopolysaccharide biosynthesis glycosyltransferase
VKPLQIFIGYDKAEPVAYHACCESIISNSSRPVSITPLYLPQLTIKTPQHLSNYQPSNGFIFSRFLTPYLSQFKGRSLFMDGDQTVLGDVAELFELPMDKLGVRVVKHDYTPKNAVKYLGAVNRAYPRKNWSSVILWNNDFYPNRKLTPEHISNSTGEYLHRFQWLEDSQIGDLPKGWNLLTEEENQVGYNEAKLLHHTNGTPCFHDYRTSQYADDWWRTYENMIHPLDRHSNSKI